MGQAAGSIAYNTFVKGLITDSSNFNSDPNSIKEGYNFFITPKGTLEKRLGLKTETSITGNSFTSDSSLVIRNATTFDGRRWYLIFDRTTRKFSILNASDNSTVYSKTVDGTNVGVDFSYNDRYVVVTSTWQYNFVLEYNVVSGWEDKGSIEVQVRDFEGVDDGLDNDTRPPGLSADHRYNLENQGWGKRFNDINVFKSDTGTYPSNADIASLGVYEDPDADGAKKFRTSNITKTYLGNTLAPRGNKILSTRDRWPRRFDGYQDCDKTRTRDCSSRDPDTGECTSYFGEYYNILVNCVDVEGDAIKDVEYPFGNTSTAVCSTFFAGRVFYGAGNNVMFSKILGQSDKDFGKCYQEADPTSEELSDLVDTDGGLVKISGASGIFKIAELGRQLVVFAKNGIWAITGGEATFTATEYSVSKVSTYVAVGPDAIAQVPGGLVILSESGILSIEEDKVTLEAAVSNLTKGVIQEYFNTFSPQELVEAKMVYSVKEGYLYIIFGEDILVLSSALGAYFKLKIPSGVISSLYQDDVQVITQESDITYNGDPVLYNTDDVVISQDSTISVVPQVRFLYPNGADVDIKSFSDTSYLDNGTDSYDAFFVTSNLMFDSPITIKRIPQLTCYFEKTETGYSENTEGGLEYEDPSKCTFQIGWDMPSVSSFNLDPRNKWSREYQAYRLTRYEAKDIGEVPGEALETVITRTSIRGRGRSALIRFSSERGYDCRILGWNFDITQTTRSK